VSAILNEWLQSDTKDGLILRITGAYTIDAIVPIAYADTLKKLSWCYEQSKGQVFATDFTMTIPTILCVTSPRVYMWKYIIYLHTGKIARAWKRKDLLNYIPNHGAIIWQEAEALL